MFSYNDYVEIDNHSPVGAGLRGSIIGWSAWEKNGVVGWTIEIDNDVGSPGGDLHVPTQYIRMIEKMEPPEPPPIPEHERLANMEPLPHQKKTTK